MKKILVILALFAASPLFSAALDGSQWVYAGASPAGTGRGYTGLASYQNAGDFLYNPASTALIKNLTVFFNTGFGSPDFVLNAGVALPLPNGILTVAGNMLASSRAAGGFSGFKVGFAKEITETFLFGFDGYFDFHTTSSNGSDLALGLDVGSLFILNDILPFGQGFGFKKNALGVALVGLGKPSLLSNADAVPGLGLRAGISGTWMDYGFFKALAGLDLTAHFLPFNIFGNLGLTFSLADRVNLRAGLILGNNGIGTFTGSGLSFFTLGASFAWQIEQIPFEVYYSFNPVLSADAMSGNHFVGLEIGFGGVDKKAPRTEIAVKNPDGAVSDTVYFSPNYDGAQDAVPIHVTIQDDSLIDDWNLYIYDEKGTLVRQLKARETRDVSLDLGEFWKRLWAKKEAVQVPAVFEWNGTSDKGVLLPEGVYRVNLVSRDELKNKGYSRTNTLILDITPPAGKLAFNDLMFSPNNDGRKDTIVIQQTLDPKDFWKAEIRDVNGQLVREWDWLTNPPSKVEWDGLNSQGALQPDGSYDYVVYGRDLAGNKTILPVKGILLTTKQYPVFLSFEKNAFSPNGDKVDDVLKITPVVPDKNGLESWTLTVKDKDGKTVRTLTGKTLPEYWSWDGKDDKEKKLTDGTYSASLKLAYQSGDEPESQPYPIVIDTAAPSVTVTTEPDPFSPDDDGENEILTVRMKIEDPQEVKKWKLVILDPDKKPFKTFEGTGEPAEVITWDGRSDTGELVESAQNYRIRVTAEDTLGNRVEKDAATVKVDVLVEKTDRGLRIRINNIEFEFGKAVLQPAGLPILNSVAQKLKRYGAYKVDIQGHTDNVGSESYNLDLSKRRAEAVFEYLARRGLGRSRMTTSGFGFQYPYADNETEEGRRKNRRVEFILIK